MSDQIIAVVFGGISNESEVSIITGTMVCNVLKKDGKSVIPLYISRDGAMFTGEKLNELNTFKNDGYKKYHQCSVVNGGVVVYNKFGKIKRKIRLSCAVNCCHGGVGEGGGVSGLFAVNNIPFASAGVFESSLFLNKYFTKLILSRLGVSTAKYVYLRDISGAIAKVNKLGFPVVVKPTTLGSSIGVAVTENKQELNEALQTAFALDDSALVEEYLCPKREINCAAYFYDGNVYASGCEEAVSSGETFTFDDKYRGGGSSVYPADIPSALSDKIQATTKKVYSALNMRGIVRFDYILSNDKLYLSEVNTVPGSLSYYLLSSGFSNFAKVLERVILQAKRDHATSQKKLLIDTGIINNFNANACKMK